MNPSHIVISNQLPTSPLQSTPIPQKPKPIQQIANNILHRDPSSLENETFESLYQLFEEEQQLLSFSLLNQYQDKDLLSLGNTFEDKARLFSHIFGDHIIRETTLEGEKREVPAEYMMKFADLLSKRSRTNLQKSCKKEIEELSLCCQHIKDSAQVISFLVAKLKNSYSSTPDVKLIQETSLSFAREIFILDKGCHFSLSGGWNGRPQGHAMVYTFIKNNDDTFDIFVSNTGAGVTTAHEHAFLQNKQKIRSLVHFSKVSAEKIFFGKKVEDINPIRFQQMIESLVMPLVDQSITIEAKTFYDNLFGDLIDHYQPVNDSIIGLMSNQQSGICAFKSILPHAYRILTQKINDISKKKTAYKQFKYELSLVTLITYYKSVEKILDQDTDEASQARNLLKEAAAKFLRNTAKLYHPESANTPKALENSEVKAAYATAKDILSRLNLHQQAACNQRRNENIVLSPESFNLDPQAQKKIEKALNKSQGKVLEPFRGYGYIPSHSYKNMECPSPEGLHLSLQELSEKQFDRDPFARKFQIESFFFSLPIPNLKNKQDYWNQIPQEQLKPCINKISKLLSKYSSDSLTPLCSTPKELDTICSLYTMVHSLALRLDADHTCKLRDYKVFFPINALMADPLTVYFEQSDFERRKAIITYFARENQILEYNFWKKTIFDFSELSSIGSNCLYNNATCIFYNDLIQQSTSLKDALKARNDSYRAINPKIYRNLSENIQFVAELIADSGSGWENLWEKSGFEHILALQNAAFISQIACGYSYGNHCEDGSIHFKVLDSGYNPEQERSYNNHPPENVRFAFQLSSGKNNNLTYCNSQQTSKEAPFLFHQMHRLLDQKAIDFLKDFEGNKRLIEKEKSFPDESQVLIGHLKTQALAQSFPFARSNCEPTMQPYLILQYFQQNCEQLEEPSNQALFDILFFKHFSRSNANTLDHYHAVFEQLPNEDNLLEQIGEFIQTGLEKFYFQRPGKRPNIYSALFMLRFSLRIKRILQGASASEKQLLNPLPDERELIREWLKRNDLTPSEKSALHLHLLATFANKKNFSINKDNIQMIIPSWIYFRQEPIKKKWCDPSLERKIQEWIYSNNPFFEKLLADDHLKNTILNQCLTQFNLEKKFTSTWTSNTYNAHYPCHYLEINQWSFWKINILTGSISNEFGILKHGTAPDWKKHQNYQRLFGTQDFDLHQIAEVYYFHSPIYGNMRIVEENPRIVKEKIDIFIQRQADDGLWYQYADPQSFEEILPLALIKDQTHWLPLVPKNAPFALEIRKKSNNCLSAAITHESSIELFENCLAALNPLKIGTVLLPEVKETSDLINRFQDIDNSTSLLIWEDLSLNRHFTFSRYLSIDGNPLSFTLEKQQKNLTWSENKNLHLCSSHPKGLVSLVPNYLALENNDKEIKKILIPCQIPLANRNFSSFSILDIERTNPLESSLKNPSPSNVEMEPDYYLEYDFKDGTLISQNPEGSLFLALLALSEKETEKALSHLNELTLSDEISPLGLKILHWIICSGKCLDRTPSSSAIRLHALYLLEKASNRPDFAHSIHDAFSSSLMDEISTNYEIYVENLNHIHPKLKLTPDQELILTNLIRTTLPQIVANRKHFLENKSYPKDQGFSIAPHNQANAFPKRNVSCWISNYDSQFIDEKPKDRIFSLLKPIESTFLANFRNFYESALTGTENDKRFIAFLMKNVRLKDGTSSKAAAIVQHALKNPEKSPILRSTYQYAYNDAATWLRNAPILNEEQASSFQKHSISSDQQLSLFPLNNTPAVMPAIIENPLPLNLSENEAYSTRPLSKYLTKKPHRTQEKLNPESLSKIEIPLNEKEKIFATAVQKDFEEFCKDFEAGRKENLERKDYFFKQADSPEHISKELISKEKEAKDASAQLLDKILQLANKAPAHPEIRQRKRLLLDGNADCQVKWEDLVLAFLKKQRKEFVQLNSHLSPQEVEILYQWIGEYLLISTQVQQIKRSLTILKRIGSLSDKEDMTKFYLLQQLGDSLTAPLTYEPSKDADCLVFEFQSNMRLREKQFRLIGKMSEQNNQSKYSNLVIQLGMGEGKTSVMASMLGYIAALNEGRLSLFMVPSPLFETVRDNLKKSQRQNFKQEVNPIDFERKKFTLKNLKWLAAQLSQSIQNRQMVLMKGEMIQSLGLEYIHLIGKLANSAEKDPSLIEKIETLREILNIFSDKADALGDEVDQLLNVLKAVNFPEGDEEKIPAERVDLVREIYSLLTSDEILIEGIPLLQFVGLKENKQSLLSEEDFHKKLKPVLANALAKQFVLLNVPKEYAESFVRYVCKEINPKLQLMIQNGEPKNLSPIDAQDLNFLKLLYSRSQSVDKEESESAHLCALAKHLLNQVVPYALEKNGNRHYGRAKSGEMGKVVPYLGVDTPATTLFGNHYEAACFHMQTAIQEGVTTDQILELANALRESAEFFSQKLKRPFDEMPEARKFKELTTIDLYTIREPGNLKKAAHHINSNLSKTLEVEAETVISKVSFHSKKLNSTPSMLVGSLNTFRTFSGTPWNDKTYPKSLSENTHLDIGSEGKIADEMFERQLSKSKIIHQVTLPNPKNILEKTLSGHSQKERVRGLIDTGALLKGINNLDAAREILDYFKDDDTVEAVVFFMRKKGQDTPDTLAMLKKGVEKPILLKSSRPEDIAQKGIPLPRIFFYYDDRHTTGTDFLQIPNAINLLTIDEKILRRTIFQGALRARQFFFSQDLEYVVLQDSVPAFVNQGQTVKDFILTGIRNQAVRKSKDTFRSYLQQIDNAVKQHALKELRNPKKNAADLPAIYRQYEKALVDEIKDSPYDQYGALEDEIPSYEALTHYVKKYQSFKEPALIKAIYNILQDAKQSPYLPKTVQNAAVEDPSMEQEIEIQTEVVKEVEQVELELNVELQLELEGYEAYPNSYRQSEKVWNDESVENLIGGSHQNLPTQILSLNESLAGAKQSDQIEYKHPYHNAFDKNIFITNNFKCTNNKALPVFHRLQKPAEQILIVQRGGQFFAYFLSLQEASFFKGWLQKNGKEKKSLCQRVWLCQPNGSLFANNPYHALPDDEPVRKILLQANFFNGNVQYLSDHEDFASSWLNSEHTEIKLRFLKLKVERSPKQKQIFNRCDIFDVGSAKIGGKQSIIFKARKCENAYIKKEAAELPDHAIAKAEACYVPFIANRQVPFLTENRQIKHLTSKQVPYLSEAQLQHMHPRQIKYLTKAKQLNALSQNQTTFVEDRQLAALEEKELVQLTNKEIIQKIPKNRYQTLQTEQLDQLDDSLIQAIGDPAVIHKLSNEKLKVLKPAQIPNLQESQFKHLKEEQISCILPQHVKFIDESNYRFLISNEQLKEVPNEKLSLLIPSQIPLLENNRLKELKTDALIQAVEMNRLQYLTTEGQIDLMTQNQLQNIPDDFIPRVPLSRVDELSLAQRRKLTQGQIRGLKSPNNIQEIEDQQLSGLQTPQLEHLLPNQIKKLSNQEHINGLPLNQVDHLDEGQIQYLTNEDALLCLAEGRKHLYLQNQIKIIENAAQSQTAKTRLQAAQIINRLSQDQMKWLDIKTMASIEDSQLKHLTEVHHIQALPANKIWYVNAEARRHMGFAAKARVAAYGAFMAFASCFAAIGTIAAIFTGVFFLRNYLSFCNRIWTWTTQPFHEVSYVFRWLLGREPV